MNLYRGDGTIKTHYEYDSWGRVLSVTDENGNAITSVNNIGHVNPIRYRGYYYDTDTGLYYLKSRYYDPELGRFVSSDDEDIILEEQGHIHQYNLFAYCFNNPVNMDDQDGEAAANIIGGIVGGAAGATLGYLLAKQLGLSGWKKWALISAATIGGAVLGAFLGPYVAKLAKSAGSAIKSTAKSIIKKAPKCHCFVAGTLIESESGHVPIETIKVGDYVYAENPETGEKGLKQVVQTFVNETTELVHIKVNGEEILCTTEHPFYVSDKGWVEACKLRAGDILVTINGEYVVVERVQHELLESPVKVYNFEVEDFHTYYVGHTSTLVHNTCKPARITNVSKT